jgi:integrase
MRKSVGRNFRGPKIKLGLPNLDQSKAVVLDSLHSPESQRNYRHSIDEFISWYCSEPRIHLESRQLAPGTVNVRLAAVRRLAYEAADSGLLSPELVAGIRRVQGAQKLGVRLGNWLTAEEARRLGQSPGTETLKGKRDRALLAVLLGCGLRRRELAELTLDLIQRREDHWAIVDLVGKAGHIRTVPIPDWVKQTAGRTAVGRGNRGRKSLSVCLQGRKNLGRWNDGEGRVACRQGVMLPSSTLSDSPRTISGAHVPAFATRLAER